MESEQQLPWTECVAHTHHFEGDCEYCEREMEQRQAALTTTQQEVMALDQRLAQLVGTPFTAHPAALAVKLDVFIDMILSDPKQRMHFEWVLMNTLKPRMMDMESQARRQVLTQPGPIIPQPRRG